MGHEYRVGRVKKRGSFWWWVAGCCGVHNVTEGKPERIWYASKYTTWLQIVCGFTSSCITLKKSSTIIFSIPFLSDVARVELYEFYRVNRIAKFLKLNENTAHAKWPRWRQTCDFFVHFIRTFRCHFIGLLDTRTNNHLYSRGIYNTRYASCTRQYITWGHYVVTYGII